MPPEALTPACPGPAPDPAIQRALKGLRVRLAYRWSHGRWPRLASPMLFTELVQRRKLHNRDARLPHLSDKVAAKAVVAARLGPEWVIPTLWHGPTLPRHRPDWPTPFVLKSRAGCRQHVFVRSPQVDWPGLRRSAARWTRRPYGVWLDEWLYSAIPPGLLVEPFIGQAGRLPVDYKFFVFGGEVHYIQVHLDREHGHRWVVLDRDWRPVTSRGPVPGRPAALSAMIAGAEELGRDFDFVRVDFYAEGDQPLFGEWTFYPGSGLLPLDPPSLDRAMGLLWREATPTAKGRVVARGVRGAAGSRAVTP